MSGGTRLEVREGKRSRKARAWVAKRALNQEEVEPPSAGMVTHDGPYPPGATHLGSEARSSPMMLFS